MTGLEWLAIAVRAAWGAIAGYLLLSLLLESPPAGLVRVNVRGRRVPAVAGRALVLATVAVLGANVVIPGEGRPGVAEGIAVLVAAAIMGVAGSWDDRRGDERARGFGGHLGALRTGSLTGGLVKILGGLVTGGVASALIPANGSDPASHVAATVLLVGLGANLVNLTDRAPGRATKVSLLIAVPLVAWGEIDYSLAAAPVLGALLATFPADLRERAMLGDAGANPVGAVLGLGLAASLGEPGRWAAVLVLGALNLASERWSFSRAIDAAPPLRWLDGLGRIRESGPK